MVIASYIGMVTFMTHSTETPVSFINELLAGKRILIIDDDEDYAEAIKEIFYVHQCEVECKKDPICALNHAMKHDYDLVIVDKNMPRMDGIELARQLREAKPSTNIILITAYPNEESRKTSIDLGIRYYLIKPFRKNELLEIVSFIFL